MIDIQKYIDELEITKQKLYWLIDGYYINCLLPFTQGKFCIPIEWIIKNYNVDLNYFKK